eukprot:2389803-Rhodomonas_salina.1
MVVRVSVLTCACRVSRAGRALRRAQLHRRLDHAARVSHPLSLSTSTVCVFMFGADMKRARVHACP